MEKQMLVLVLLLLQILSPTYGSPVAEAEADPDIIINVEQVVANCAGGADAYELEEADTCFYDLTEEYHPQGTTGYYKCEQYECSKNGTWYTNGETLSGCNFSSFETSFCNDWMKDEIVPQESEMNSNCITYKCGADDWERSASFC